MEVGAGDTLATSPLRIDERVLHYLAGVEGPDERLRGLLLPVAPPDALPAGEHALTRRIVALWQEGPAAVQVVQLAGLPTAARGVAAAAAALLGRQLYALRAADVPAGAADRDLLARLWAREALLGDGLLLVDFADGEGPGGDAPIRAFLGTLRTPVLLAAREPLHASHLPLVVLDLPRADAAEQAALWTGVLGPLAGRLNGHVEALAGQFSLSLPEIRAAHAAVAGDAAASGDEIGARLWEACRAQARPRLDDLAMRIPPVATWDDLVLPAPQRAILQAILAHVRHRRQVYDAWGFRARSARGLGISALFAGASGTGKTLAAEVLAGALRLDLYRIDLSQVVSKYIGETEKNLRRVFDAAESGGAILLFDEADALFGKRSEVKDSHDRYANIEVSYLLQRMEAYEGLAILTTNQKTALDTAFLRRIRFVVQFPFPDTAERAAIWRRIFPPSTPTAGLDPAKLARLNIAGGNIRNIALGAAFLAAAAGSPVTMAHVLEAARAEYLKIEKPLTEAEIGSWL